MIKLIAVDLDGTLIDHDFRTSQRVLSTLEQARDRGMLVTIATGRGPTSTRPFAKRIGVNAPVVCTQGGVVHDLATCKDLMRVTLARDIAIDVLALARRFVSWHPVLYIDDRIHIEALAQSEAFYREMLVPDAPIIAPDLSAALVDRDADKLLFVVAPHEAADALVILRRHLGSRATVVQSHAMFVEVNPAAASKGAALAFLANHLGIHRRAVLAIGDQDNDVSMLEWAGTGVAMGNASAAAKAAADWIAPDISHDGVAVAIEKFALK